MFILIKSGGVSTIHEREDFKRFAVKVEADEAHLDILEKSAAPLVKFESSGTAWVDIVALKAFPELSGEEQGAAIDKMVASAAPHGWVSGDGKAIKSHIVWLGSST